MTQRTHATPQPASVGKRMLTGAGIGLVLISFFLAGVDHPNPAWGNPAGGNPAWGKLWMVRPLLVVSIAGAMGGLCNYIIMQFRDRVGASKVVALIISLLVFIVGLWLGTVLGLDGTLWN